jgi:hypothetical protein
MWRHEGYDDDEEEEVAGKEIDDMMIDGDYGSSASDETLGALPACRFPGDAHVPKHWLHS